MPPPTADSSPSPTAENTTHKTSSPSLHALANGHHHSSDIVMSDNTSPHANGNEGETRSDDDQDNKGSGNKDAINSADSRPSKEPRKIKLVFRTPVLKLAADASASVVAESVSGMQTREAIATPTDAASAEEVDPGALAVTAGPDEPWAETAADALAPSADHTPPRPPNTRSQTPPGTTNVETNDIAGAVVASNPNSTTESVGDAAIEQATSSTADVQQPITTTQSASPTTQTPAALSAEPTPIPTTDTADAASVEPTPTPTVEVPAAAVTVPSTSSADNTPTGVVNDVTAVDTAVATEASILVPDDKPKRPPRKKRRRALRRGEVDPDDLEAVAAQKARHEQIDLALASLKEQEQQVLNDTHPKLLTLWSDLEERFNRIIGYRDAQYEAQQAELKKTFDLEQQQNQFQFYADREDISLQMTFEIARKKARLAAEKVYHDMNDGRPSNKRMFTNMPMLGEGRGCGGWYRHPTSLLSDQSEDTAYVVKDAIVRKRRRIDLGPEGATATEAIDDLIELGLREPEPEPEPSPEPESEDDDEIMVDEPALMLEFSPPSPEPAPIPSRLPPPPHARVTPSPAIPSPVDLRRSPPLRIAHSQSPSAPFNLPPPPMMAGRPLGPPQAAGPPSRFAQPPPGDRRWDEFERRTSRTEEQPLPLRDDPLLHRDLREARDLRDPRDARDPREPRELRDPRDPRTRDPRDPRDLRGPSEQPLVRHHEEPLDQRGPYRDNRTWFHRPTPSFNAPPPPAPPPPSQGAPPGYYRNGWHENAYQRPPAAPMPPMRPPQTATATGPPPPPQPPTATISGDGHWARNEWNRREQYYSRPPRTAVWGEHPGPSAPAGYATGRP
ncbi:hypothetical protein CcaverHIS002_0210430 [Cutaneotrichosporon cavernicola]|uniref:Sds3-like-domain-containing protein n=1 Tax=Cutaneotrichosporon cavernicola TaxID=279322 RepID=A0AA48I5H1_9TREE|nr:uncharacterized protein CcaverHIS019_0210440 [Cutaneotrichosporon cavernicola]BEI81883.1 hypothetical protein CcaverHIS002_0210430 [Cutaneotrichosporon cavernicola]BEI89682.1 hypothetical protein CcaverHIS019_0210440 [Cutaneotrichosporon cavernicola]BEI97453.1 hypothetical protein CcaverHIS631_0210420 [Cutaneotrichosporon cavernicola]BEJ05231.1 hypothetical protein CcaverHIS641_0210480 [Cutaneotrichosporon cavernicola]